MQMHEDESEVKYFTKFLRPYLRPDCNIVTLGMLKLANKKICAPKITFQQVKFRLIILTFLSF